MTLSRAVTAEALGTASLVAIVVGSGIMGERLSHENAAVALLANALATGCGLYVLITLFSPVSGAHFNPAVSLVAWIDGKLSRQALAAYLMAQVLAGIGGTLLAHAMFDLEVLQIGIRQRSGAGQMLSEIVATAGLVSVIQGIAPRKDGATALAVASYIVAAYWFTASTSFANPAVTVARSLTTTFSGISPLDVPAFVLAQFIGAGTGLALSRSIFGAAVKPA